MKKFLYVVSLILSVCAATSCSGGAGEELLDRVPANAGCVVICQVRTALESADVTLGDEGNQISLPSYLISAMPEMQMAVREGNDILQKSGIDISAVALFADDPESNPITVVKLNDAGSAEEYLKENYSDAGSSDGVKFFCKNNDYSSYYNYQECAAIYDGYLYTASGFFTADADSPKSRIAKAIADAGDKPFSKLGVASAMTQGNLGAAAINTSSYIDDLLREQPDMAPVLKEFKGYLLITADTEGPEASMEMALVDDGGDVKTWPALPAMKLADRREQGAYNFVADIYNNRAPFNAATLRYLPSDVNLVYGFNIGNVNWNDLVDDLDQAGAFGYGDATMVRLLAAYLGSLQGSVAVGLGYDGNITDLADTRTVQRLISLGIVMETKPGKARQTIDDIQAIAAVMGGSADFRLTNNGVALDLPGDDTTLYFSAADNMLIISNRPFTGAADNAVSRNVATGNSPIVVALAADRSNAAISQLGLECGICAYAVTDVDKAQVKMAVRATDTSAKLIPLLVKSMINISQNQELIDAFSGRRTYDYGYQYYDSEPVFVDEYEYSNDYAW